jgi:hypothetical protein
VRRLVRVCRRAAIADIEREDMADPQPAGNGAPTDALPIDDWMDQRFRELAQKYPELDRSKLAKYIAGEAAMEINRPIGVVQGAGETVKGLFDTALFAGRLLNPIDPLLHDQGDAAWDHVADAVGDAIDYGDRAYHDPSLLRRDAQNGMRKFRASIDPSATPMADTFAGEIQRKQNIARNQGKVALDVASLAEGGLALKGMAKIGAFKPMAAAEYAAAGFRPRQIARMMEPYDGVGHHAIPVRATEGLPQWLRDNPFFTVRPTGITRGDMYQLHYGVDPWFDSARLPKARGGPKSWHGEKLNQRRYGPLNRYVFGTPEPVQQAATVNAFGTAFKPLFPELSDLPDDPNHSRVQNQYSR